MSTSLKAIKNFVYGKSQEEMVKELRQKMRREIRSIERNIRSMDPEENKVKKEIKAAAKRQDVTSCKLLAKELVRSQKHKQRLYVSKAQMNSIILELETQLRVIKVAGAIEKNASVMQKVNQLVRVPELAVNMREYAREMEKAGIIGEIIEDTIDMMDDEELDAEADAEVDKVLFEITEGLLGEAKQGSVEKPEASFAQNIPQDLEDDTSLDMMQRRLEALKN